MCMELATTYFRREKGRVYVTFENHITRERFTKSYRTERAAAAASTKFHNKVAR